MLKIGSKVVKQCHEFSSKLIQNIHFKCHMIEELTATTKNISNFTHPRNTYNWNCKVLCDIWVTILYVCIMEIKTNIHSLKFVIQQHIFTSSVSLHFDHIFEHIFISLQYEHTFLMKTFVDFVCVTRLDVCIRMDMTANENTIYAVFMNNVRCLKATTYILTHKHVW